MRLNLKPHPNLILLPTLVPPPELIYPPGGGTNSFITLTKNNAPFTKKARAIALLGGGGQREWDESAINEPIKTSSCFFPLLITGLAGNEQNYQLKEQNALAFKCIIVFSISREHPSTHIHTPGTSPHGIKETDVCIQIGHVKQEKKLTMLPLVS